MKCQGFLICCMCCFWFQGAFHHQYSKTLRHWWCCCCWSFASLNLSLPPWCPVAIGHFWNALSFWLFGFGGINPFRIPRTKFTGPVDFRLRSQNCGFLRICTSMLGVMSVISIASQVFWLRQSRMAVRGRVKPKEEEIRFFDIFLECWFVTSFWHILTHLRNNWNKIMSVDSSTPHCFFPTRSTDIFLKVFH